MTVFLETERLLLRPFTEADADRLVELDGDQAGGVGFRVAEERPMGTGSAVRERRRRRDGHGRR